MDQRHRFNTVLAVSQRSKRQHVLGRWNVGRSPRRSSETKDQDVVVDIRAARNREPALSQRPTGHALVETKLDPFLGVVGFVVQENLGYFDLATQKLFREVWTVVRSVFVGADNDDLTVKAALAQSERGRVTCASAADDDRARHLPF